MRLAVILAVMCSVAFGAWHDTLWTGTNETFTNHVEKIRENFVLVNGATGLANYATAAGLVGATNPLASRAYVDGATNVASGADRVLKAGDTMGGPLRVSVVTSTQDVDDVATTLTLQGADGIAGGGVTIRAGRPTVSDTPEDVVVELSGGHSGAATNKIVVGRVVVTAGGQVTGVTTIVTATANVGNNLLVGDSIQAAENGGSVSIYSGGGVEEAGDINVHAGHGLGSGGIGGDVLIYAGAGGGDGSAECGDVVIKANRFDLYADDATGNVVISDLQWPTEPREAASKEYVDAATKMLRLPLLGDKTTAVYPSGEYAGGGNTLVGAFPQTSNKDAWWWIPVGNQTGFTTYVRLSWLPNSIGVVWSPLYHAVRNAGATGDYTDVNYNALKYTNAVAACNFIVVTNQWTVKQNSTIEYLLNSSVSSITIGTAVITRIEYRLD